MRNRKSGFTKALSALAVLGVIAVGVVALTTDATARPPRPGWASPLTPSPVASR